MWVSVGIKFSWNASSFIVNPKKKKKKIEVNTSNTADMKKIEKPNQLN